MINLDHVAYITPDEEAQMFLPYVISLTKNYGYINRQIIMNEIDVSKKVARLILDKVIFHLKRESMSFCCIPSKGSEDKPTVDVDVTVDVSGCNCCGLTSTKKKKKTKTVQAPRVSQTDEVEKVDKKIQRSSTTIIFMAHEESKSGEE